MNGKLSSGKGDGILVKEPSGEEQGAVRHRTTEIVDSKERTIHTSGVAVGGKNGDFDFDAGSMHYGRTTRTAPEHSADM